MVAEQTGILIRLAAQEDSAHQRGKEKTNLEIALITFDNGCSRKTRRNTASQQDERVNQWVGQFGGQLPVAIADLQVEVGRDEVGEDQRFRGDEEDHAPPVDATSCFVSVFVDCSDLLAVSITHSLFLPHARLVIFK